MPQVSRTQIFPFSHASIFEVVADVEQYPAFVDGMDKIVILESDKKNNTMKVEYSINIIKNFRYTILMKLEPEKCISWELVGGDLFKKNNGRWDFRILSEKETEVVYSLDVEFKLFAPSFIVDKLVSQSLPQMMNAFESRVRFLKRKQA
ncbi:MAG: SRPBCC family protein [Bacteriovoracaceae bacterium]|nr:SRPBCC family protein [Bacteriovoracaceae bacterium]